MQDIPLRQIYITSVCGTTSIVLYYLNWTFTNCKIDLNLVRDLITMRDAVVN